MEPRPGPLHGIRILDLGSVVMAPYATQMLGDLGADVIKVEAHDGDSTRQAGSARNPGMGAVFLTLGRNKRSVALDLKRPQGRAVLRRLAAQADVVVHNMRPDATRRLELDYETLRAIRPELVYCAARGFRSTGPYRDMPALDDMIQGLSGTAAILGELMGEPSYVPMIYVDKTVGLFVANGILAALVHRLRTGQGQQVEVPMFEVMTAFTLVEHLYDATFEPPRAAPGYPRVMSRWRRPYRTADGHVCVLPYSNRHFERFLAWAGRPELMQDERFRDIPARLRNVDTVYTFVGEVLARHRTEDCLRGLQEADIPCAPVRTLSQILADPHLEAVGFFQMQDHPTEGLVRQYALPLYFSETPATIRRPAPRLGEHGPQVLEETGYSPAEIAALVDAGVLKVPGPP
jgi:crotonobetainyl-CoA:carnitine CoA-transferase CaiB-like acyl-CoA transferase